MPKSSPSRPRSRTPSQSRRWTRWLAWFAAAIFVCASAWLFLLSVAYGSRAEGQITFLGCLVFQPIAAAFITGTLPRPHAQGPRFAVAAAISAIATVAVIAIAHILAR